MDLQAYAQNINLFVVNGADLEYTFFLNLMVNDAALE